MSGPVYTGKLKMTVHPVRSVRTVWPSSGCPERLRTCVSWFEPTLGVTRSHNLAHDMSLRPVANEVDMDTISGVRSGTPVRRSAAQSSVIMVSLSDDGSRENGWDRQVRQNFRAYRFPCVVVLCRLVVITMGEWCPLNNRFMQHVFKLRRRRPWRHRGQR